MDKRSIIITCPLRLAPFLEKEVAALNFPIMRAADTFVQTSGTLSDTMVLNLYIRTGHKVLFLIDEFSASTVDELYKKVLDMKWEDYLHEDGYISVDSYAEHPDIKDGRFANLKCKDAIVDRMRRIYGRRPDSGPQKNKSVIYLYWVDNKAAIYIDTSGQTLAKHGYRKISVEAPMQESLAAAVVMATGYNGQGNLINPMCGSGTLAIEAALIALNKPAGAFKSNYGFMHIKGFDEALWRDLRKKTKEQTKRSLTGTIMATDINSDAIESARNNAATAGVEHLIEFKVCDFRDTPVPQGPGAIILNPEYGQRTGQASELRDVYRGIGDFFKNKCAGYTGYIFTGNLELAKYVGLKTKRKIMFYNGDIDCRLLEYELYEGSKKRKFVQ